jgi:sec-independent protein translocase protein TatC
MPKRSDDNLFATSTMSFGEHLEELRVALFRAMGGLMIGFLLGLMIATYVVKWIQTPLSGALKSYYLDSALLRLQSEYHGNPPPEAAALIEEESLIPEPVQVDPFDFFQKLKGDYPDQFQHLEFTTNRFIVDDVDVEHAAALCRQMAEGAEANEDAAPASAVWNLLTEDQRASILALKDNKNFGAEDRRALVEILNSLVEKRDLHEAEAFRDLTKLSQDDVLVASVEAVRARLDGHFELDQSRRLNRFLLGAMFEPYIRRPRTNLVELTTWKPIDVRVQTLSAHEAFMIWVKAALIAGIIISSPWIFWQIWEFVAAGLYPHEKHYVHVFLPFSLGLFFAGAGLAFFFVFEPVLDFLFSFNRKMNIDPDPRISEWLSFVLFLPLGFGISFQLPLVMLFLHRIGVITVESYLSKWRIAILVIFVASMLLTPADPVSMLLMALPLTVLYFGGVALCHWLPKRKSPFGEAYEP